jgi:hypothetical protein
MFLSRAGLEILRADERGPAQYLAGRFADSIRALRDAALKIPQAVVLGAASKRARVAP